MAAVVTRPTKKELEMQLKIYKDNYNQIIEELFPNNIDGFNKKIDHDRVIKEIKSIRIINSRNVKLNIIVGNLKEIIEETKISFEKILRDF